MKYKACLNTAAGKPAPKVGDTVYWTRSTPFKVLSVVPRKPTQFRGQTFDNYGLEVEYIGDVNNPTYNGIKDTLERKDVALCLAPDKK